MKKVLLVAASADSVNWLALRDSIRSKIGSDLKVDMTTLTQLVFDISSENSRVLDTVNKSDVADYEMVIIRNVGRNTEQAITLAQYLKLKNVPFTDSYLETRGSGKLSSTVPRVRNDLSVPRTVYSSSNAGLIDYIRSGVLNLPFILKADNGKKGRDNYLVHSIGELEERLNEQPNVEFIAQEMIPNDGDYRALVMGDRIVLVIKRTASGGSHLNNTSQGGSAQLVDRSVFSTEIQDDILRAAKLDGLEIAGVDLIFDKNTGKHYFLEVNRAPQLNTGAYVDEKILAYAEFIKQRVGV